VSDHAREWKCRVYLREHSLIWPIIHDEHTLPWSKRHRTCISMVHSFSVFFLSKFPNIEGGCPPKLHIYSMAVTPPPPSFQKMLPFYPCSQQKWKRSRLPFIQTSPRVKILEAWTMRKNIMYLRGHPQMISRKERVGGLSVCDSSNKNFFLQCTFVT